MRLYKLEVPSFFNDELRTVNCTTKLFHLNRSKTLGYIPTAIGLWMYGPSPSQIPQKRYEAWQDIGVTEFSARAASCVIGILTVPLLALASRSIIGGRAAVVLGLLLAVAPWHVYWSQTARFYAPQFLFYNLGLIWYFLAVERRSTQLAIWAMLFALLAFLCQPPALVIITIFAADLAIRATFGRSWKIFFVGLSAVGVLSLVALTILTLDVTGSPGDWSVFARSRGYGPIGILLGCLFWIQPAFVVLAILIAFRGVTIRSRQSIYLALGALLPILGFMALSAVLYVRTRYVFVCLYSWLALSSVAVVWTYDAIRPRYGRALAFAPLGLLLAPLLVSHYIYFTQGAGLRPRWREAFAYVDNHRASDQAVRARLPDVAKYYLQDASVKLLPCEVSELADEREPLWLVADSSSGDDLRWLDGHAELKAVYPLPVFGVNTVFVYLYDPPNEKDASRDRAAAEVRRQSAGRESHLPQAHTRARLGLDGLVCNKHLPPG